MEYLIYKQLDKVLEHHEIKQKKVVVLETFQKVVHKNILPDPEFLESNKYILQQLQRPVIQQYQPRKLSDIITQSQPGSLAQRIRQLPSAALVQVLSQAPPATLAYLLQRTSSRTLGGIVSQTSDNTLVAVLSEAPTNTLAEYMSGAPFNALVNVLTNVWGRTLGQLIYEVHHDVRELWIQSAQGNSIGDNIGMIYADEMPDHLQNETTAEILNFLAVVHADVLSSLMSQAQEPGLRAIFQECPPSVLANMISQHDVAELLQVLGECEAGNVAQLVRECPENTQANFLCLHNDVDISHTICLMRTVSLSNLVQQLQMPQQQQTQQQTQPTGPRRSSQKQDPVDYAELNEYGKKR